MNDGKVIYTGEPIALDDVGGYLENEKRVMISAGKEPGAATVIVRADGRSRTGDVQQMIRICQEKGFERFVLRAQYDESK